MTTKKSGAQKLALAAQDALKAFNQDFGFAYSFGTNWSTTEQGLKQTFIYDYFFPKIASTDVINIALGNRFDWLAKEYDFVAQYSEEYVVMDSVPSGMNLSKEEELMLKRNYPRVATKLYTQGITKKMKFTLNDNDVRLNFLTIGDAVSYALAVFMKSISDINVSEEKEVKAMIIDYADRFTREKRTVADEEELFDAIALAILDLQDNEDKYNETNAASGGAIGRFTSFTDMDDIVILTTNKVKVNFLNSKIANTYQVKGIDFTKKIISFGDLGGTWRATEDITITDAATLAYFKSFGIYQTNIGDVIHEDEVFTFDVSQLTEFVGKVEEIKPSTDLWAYVLDVNAIRYKRSTKNMYKKFENPEFQEVNHWNIYNSMKHMSPFFNKILIMQGDPVDRRVPIKFTNEAGEEVPVDINLVGDTTGAKAVTGSVGINGAVTTNSTIKNTDTNPVPTKEVKP